MTCQLLPKKARILRSIIFTSIFFTIIISMATIAHAAITIPGYRNVVAPLVSPETANEILEETATLAAASIKFASTPTESSPEIQELARGLKNDPELIYKFVRNHIDYIPIFGSVKGSTMTLYDRMGNDFDQTSLYIALMREAGYTANYVYGVIRLTPEEISNRLGIEADVDVVGKLLASAGIPAQRYINPSGDLAYVDLAHVWAKADIDGTDYVFDVSFKPYTYTSGIDLPSAMQYNQTTFMNNALDGSTVDTDYVQNINTTNIRGDLSTYSMNLISYIKDNMFDASLAEVIGGREITTTDSVPYQTSLPYQQSVYYEWTEIPTSYCATLRIQHLGIDETFNSFELYGKRLTIFYNGSDQPELRLDGTLKATGSMAIPDTDNDITLTVNHPYAAYGGTYCDQCLTTQITAGGSYLIVNGWGGTGRNIIEKHRKLLKENIAAGGPGDSESVLGETFAVMGLTWLSEFFNANHIADMIANTVTIYHHKIGLYGEYENPFIDMPMCSVSVISADGNQDKEDACFAVQSGIGSAFEWGVIEQLQPYGAVSTVKLIHISNSNSDKVFDADSLNYYTVVKPQLVNYDQDEFDLIEAYINAGCRLTLPEDGNLNEEDWFGVGLTIWCADDSVIGHIISGGLSGGYATRMGGNEPDETLYAFYNSSENEKSSEPVDLVTGDYLYNTDDISIGSGKFPTKITFSRSYNSAARREDGPLGNGWTHNFDITAEKVSNGFQGLGADSPIDAAPAIAEIYGAIGIFIDSNANAQTVIVTLSHKWFMDQLIDKVVNVKIAGDSYQFIELPDGTFNPPPASADTLIVEPDSTYLLDRKYGFSLDFDTDGNIVTWSDPQNTVSFQYNGGKLTQVSDEFTRFLQFTYDGNQIDTITDSASPSRSVSYGYDILGNLTTYTNAETKDTTFAYDSKNRLEQIYYPANPANPFVTNTYDELDRVKEQTNARDYTYNFFYSYYRTEEEDPLDHSHTRFFDELNHLVAEEDALGNKTEYTYDGRGRRTSITYPIGNSTEYEYDDKHNTTEITQIPVPGSSEPNIVETFTYEPQFSFIDTYTDPRGNFTKNYYDGNSNLTKVEQPEVGGQKPTTDFTYNTHGQVETITNPEGEVTKNIYDPATGDLLQIIVDYGINPEDLNLTTIMDYDTVGNVFHRTDPEGNTTTYQYNDLRQLTQTTAPTPFSYITTYSYDDDGNLEQVARETGVPAHPWQTMDYTYTPTGKHWTITDGEGHVTTNEYDEADRLWKVTDAEDHTTERLYDENGRLWKIIDGRGNTAEEHSYNENGKQDWLKDGRGNQTTYEYDDFDRLEKTIYPDLTYEELTYDEAGNITEKRTRAGQTIGYSYDELNRQEAKTLPGPETINYYYDLASRLTDVTDPTGTITHAYDDAGGLLSVTYPDSKVVNYQYDDAGNRTRLTYPDSSYVTYDYDELNRLTDIYDQGVTLLAHYSYDDLSRRTGLSYANSTSVGYDDYDWANNLLNLQHQFNGSTLDFSYSYDDVGNRIGMTISDDYYAYNPLDDQIDYSSNELNQYASVGGASYIYDDNGNLTSDGVNSYTYDAENQLLTADTSSYEYDPLGRRISKTVNSTTTKYLYDDVHILCEYDSGDQLLRKYVYGPGIDRPVRMISDSQTYYYHLDGLGSVVSLTDSSGNPVEGYTYDTYGEPIIFDPATGTPRSTSSIDNPYMYTGRRYDEESELYYYRARYYSHVIGRFLQVDPIGYAGNINLYTYVKNAPVNWIDPLGLCKENKWSFWETTDISYSLITKQRWNDYNYFYYGMIEAFEEEKTSFVEGFGVEVPPEIKMLIPQIELLLLANSFKKTIWRYALTTAASASILVWAGTDYIASIVYSSSIWSTEIAPTTIPDRIEETKYQAAEIYEGTEEAIERYLYNPGAYPGW